MPPSSSHREVRKYEGRASVAEVGGRQVIRGHAIVFNEPSLVLGRWMGDGGFQEIIKPEAIQRTFREQIDLRAFFDHDPGRVLGRLSSGTLRARVDARGLAVEIDPDPEIRDHADLMRSIQRGDISGMSFSFETMAQGDRWDESTKPVTREVTDMRVFEVSVVAMPAYEQTDVQVALRSRAAARGDLKTVKDLQMAAEQRAAAWRR